MAGLSVTLIFCFLGTTIAPPGLQHRGVRAYRDCALFHLLPSKAGGDQIGLVSHINGVSQRAATLMLARCRHPEKLGIDYAPKGINERVRLSDRPLPTSELTDVGIVEVKLPKEFHLPTSSPSKNVVTFQRRLPRPDPRTFLYLLVAPECGLIVPVVPLLLLALPV